MTLHRLLAIIEALALAAMCALIGIGAAVAVFFTWRARTPPEQPGLNARQRSTSRALLHRRGADAR